MTIIHDLNDVDKIIAEGEKDLGMVLISVKHDGSYQLNSTFTPIETLKTIVNTVHVIIKDMSDD